MRATSTLPKCTARIMTFRSLIESDCGRKVRKVPSKDHSKSTFKSAPPYPDPHFFKKIYKIL